MEHAHWIQDIHYKTSEYEYTCSKCKWGFDDPYNMYISVEEYNYCPHCGAKMDEEEKENEHK